MATKQLIVIVAVMTMVAGCLSCGYVSNTVPGILEPSDQKATLEEAGYLVGWPVPTPTYLPQGYEIREVCVEDKTVVLLISDEEIRDEQWKMKMNISWHELPPPELKLPGEKVEINESEGVIVDRGDHNDLCWHWYLDPKGGTFEFKLSAIKELQREELVKVAESVSLPPPPPPGKALLEAARIALDDSIELKAGETKVLDVTLETLKHGPGEVSYKIFRVAREYGKDEIPMPEGLEVSMEPTKFMAYPNAVYHSAITIKTTPELAPGEYWLSFEAEFEGEFRMTGCIRVNVVP